MELPDKPSALIRLALDDLRKVEAQSDIYEVTMSNYWHAVISGTGKCCVCLAGAVIAGTLGASPQTSTCPPDYPLETKNRLYALDHFRRGAVVLGVREFFGLDQSEALSDVIGTESAIQLDALGEDINQGGEWPDYDKDPAQWFNDMETLANRFEKIGL